MRRLAKAALVSVVPCLLLLASCGGGGGSDGSDPTDPSNPPTGVTSVCGGAVTSVPKICDLEARDAGVVGGVRYLRFRYCVSDREGDIDSVCVAVGVNGVVDSECATGQPRGSLINECRETEAIAIGPRGIVSLWTVAMNVGDRQGNVSDVASTQFTCCS